MKLHPLMTIGVVLVSVVVGYHLRSGFPAADPALSEPEASRDQGVEAGTGPAPGRSVEEIEAANEIRRAVEERERALVVGPEGDPTAPLPDPAAVAETFSATPFHDELAADGEWIETDDYGEIWRPRYADDSDWRPYVDGSWAYTDAGWTWDSDEPWGDITCHYGRWLNLADTGWCWVPGSEWAPAWVSWRCSDAVIGWAPLPPCVPWRPAAGLGPWVDACGDLGPGSYCFIPIRHFAAGKCRPVLCARSESAEHFCGTRNVTRLVCKPGVDGRSSPVLQGPDPDRIAALSPKGLRHRRLHWIEPSHPRLAKGADPDVVSVRRLDLPAVAGTTSHRTKALRRLDHASVVNPWQEAGDPQMLAAARRRVFDEARATFRGLPRWMPPVDAVSATAPRPRLDPANPVRAQRAGSAPAQPPPPHASLTATSGQSAAPREQPGRRGRPAESTRPVALAVAPEPAIARPAVVSVADPPQPMVRQERRSPLATARLEPATRPLGSPGLEPAVSLDRRSVPAALAAEPAEHMRPPASRDQDARQALQQQRAAQGLAARQAREAHEQQELQRQRLAAQQEQEQQWQANEERAQQVRHQAILAEQRQQQRLETERQAAAQWQRQQAEAQQRQELERHEQMEQARQQAMLQARRQEEAQQRERVEHAHRQAENQARQAAAEQRHRENEAREQQAAAQRRQAEEMHQRQQRQEAQERAHAARQQQAEAARQQHQAEAARQREHEAARQDGGRSQEKRGR